MPSHDSIKIDEQHFSIYIKISSMAIVILYFSSFIHIVWVCYTFN